MVRFFLKVALLWLLPALALDAQVAGLSEATRWRFDRRDLFAEPDSTVATPLTQRGRPTFVAGRRGYGLSLKGDYGPLSIPQAALGPGTWSVGFYARAQDLRHRTRVLAWGRAPLHYLDLLPDGRLEWGLETQQAKQPAMLSLQRLGAQSWHHVAIAVSQEETFVYLNGVRQGTLMAHSDPLKTPLQIAPRSSRFGPFQGDVDELVALPFHSMEGTWSREEPYLIFRSIILKDLQDLNLILHADELRAPTYEGTARIRRYVHSLFTAHLASTAPVDPLSVNWADGGLETYIFSPAISLDTGLSREVGNLFLAIRSGHRNGYCGAASFILRGIYKAFGYEPRVRDFIHRNGRDTYVLVEVKIVETGRWVFQDPTYDLGGRSLYALPVQFAGINELIQVANRPIPPSVFPFEHPEVDSEEELLRAWSFSKTGAHFYMGYFHRQARTYPPEMH